jgi:hypothetical protein
MALLEALILVPVAFAWLARFYAKDPVLHRTFYLVGPFAAVAAYFVFANFAPLSGLRDLIAALKAKLLKEGVQANSWGGVTVGFAPAPSPRIYEHNTNWDIGSFFIRSDRLCYCGEETKFALRREHITAIVLGPGVPGLLTNRRIYIAWKDPELGRSGTFNIGCIEGRSILEIRRKTTQLEGVLQDWWKASADARPLPAQLAELTSPLIGAVTSAAPNANWRFGRILKELWLTGVIAAIAAVLCGLRFQLVAYLFSTPATRVVSAAFVHSPGAGWYVVCVAVVLRGLALVPFLGYKDKSFVAAPTLGVPPPPAPSASSPSSKSESGTVLAG